MKFIYQAGKKFCQCQRCFHFFAGNKLFYWETRFPTRSPSGKNWLEVDHEWWLCEECYNHQLCEVERQIAKEQENG